ncbi:MAG: response regulator [Proteobacteria bacterium]|nr:response regulator [Pseudomonadota bacterium]
MTGRQAKEATSAAIPTGFADENPEPVLRVALTGEVLYANAPARRLIQEGGGLPTELLDLMFGTGKTGSAYLEWLNRRMHAVVARFPNRGYVNFYLRDETPRQRAEEALARTTGRFRALIARQAAGSLVLDERGGLVLANQSFLALFTLRGLPESYEGRDGRSLLARLQAEVVRSGSLLSLLEGEVGTTLALADGRKVSCHGQSIVLAGEPVGRLLQFQDVTAERDHRDELQRAKQLAERARDAKTDFIAHVSHEVRTPLAALLGMARLLLDTQLSPEQGAYAQSVLTNGEIMLALMNDVLEVSKLEDGALQLVHEPLSLLELVEGVVESQGARVARGVELYAAVDPELPALILGDATRLRQVLTNLVSNAAKYTDKGEISVLAHSLGIEEDRVRLRLVVRDTGIGVSFAQQERIFQKYVQSSTHRGGTGLGLHITRSIIDLMGGELRLVSRPGAGATFTVDLTLGVSLQRDEELETRFEAVRGLRVGVSAVNRYAVRALKAPFASLGIEAERVRLENLDLDQIRALDVVLVNADLPPETIHDIRRCGTEVVVARSLTDDLEVQGLGWQTIFKPIRTRHLLESVRTGLSRVDDDEDEVTAVDPRGPSLRVLLVEDDSANRELGRQVLTRAGHIVTTADCGRAAVERARAGDLDVIVMDLNMPGLNGFEATKRIRRAEAAAGLQNVPILAFSAHTTPEIRERALEVGCVDFLAKPTPSHRLMAALHRAVAPRGRVLVVDDGSDSRRLSRHLLLREGYLAPSVADGDAALAYLDRNPVDVVLLDIEMPGRGGLSTVTEIRSRGWTLPVIATTAHVGRDAEWLAAGFTSVLPKPFHAADLLRAIHTGLAVRTDGPAPPRQTLSVAVDVDLRPLIPAFLNDRRTDIVNLKRHLAQGEFDSVKRIGHSMRGTGTAYGFPFISAVGKTLEEAAERKSTDAIRRGLGELDRYMRRVQVQYR